MHTGTLAAMHSTMSCMHSSMSVNFHSLEIIMLNASSQCMVQKLMYSGEIVDCCVYTIFA